MDRGLIEGCPFNGTFPDYGHGHGALEIWYRIFSIYLPPILLTFGIIGNSLIILTVHQSRFRESVVVFHFKALAVADILSSFDMVHGIIIQTSPQLLYPLGNFFCKEHQFTSYTCIEVAAWCVVSLTMDRFVAICFPLKKSTWCTRRKAKVVLSANVLFHIGLNIPRLVFLEFHCPTGADHIYFEICQMPHVPAWYRNCPEFLHQVLDVAAPCVLVVITNTMILLKLRKNRLKHDQLGCSSRPNSGEHSGSCITRMLLIMSFAFVFFMSAWTIDYTYWVVIHPDEAKDHPAIRRLMFSVTYVFVTCNNQFNFYIYMTSSASFRGDFKRLCRRILTKDKKHSRRSDSNQRNNESKF